MPNGVKLHCREAHFHIGGCPLSRLLWIGVNISLLFRLRSGGWIQICIAPQSFVVLAAEQVIYRLIQGFTNDIPAGHFNSTNYPHLGQVWMLIVTASIDSSP
ncbi:hypothetical protein ES703_103972 [subsurface metagenome]